MLFYYVTICEIVYSNKLILNCSIYKRGFHIYFNLIFNIVSETLRQLPELKYLPFMINNDVVGK